MKKDPNLELVLDDWTLLKLIRSIDKEETNWYIDQIRVYTCFTVLFDNEMLRKILSQLLEANIKVSLVKTEIKNTKFKWFRRKFSKVYFKQLNSISDLEKNRDKTWDEYEVMRRLICYQNKSLIVRKA
jgi:hypothetical protein